MNERMPTSPACILLAIVKLVMYYYLVQYTLLKAGGTDCFDRWNSLFHLWAGMSVFLWWWCDSPCMLAAMPHVFNWHWHVSLFSKGKKKYKKEQCNYLFYLVRSTTRRVEMKIFILICFMVVRMTWKNIDSNKQVTWLLTKVSWLWI